MLEEGCWSWAVPEPWIHTAATPLSPGLLAPIQRRWRHNGMNSLGYRLLSKELQPPYTNLIVDINFPTPGAPMPS